MLECVVSYVIFCSVQWKRDKALPQFVVAREGEGKGKGEREEEEETMKRRQCRGCFLLKCALSLESKASPALYATDTYFFLGIPFADY